MVKVFRVRSLPAVLQPSSLYVVASGDNVVEQYFTGSTGLARRATLLEGEGIEMVGNEIRIDISSLPTAP